MTTRSLQKILGVGFGLAIAFGTMVGVGILRLPGAVAAAVGSPSLVMLCWTVGGLYTVLAALSITELATMYPEAGGFRVYARRAFGEGTGFLVGWIDWLAGVATLAYGAVTVVDFAGTLWAPLALHEQSLGIGLLLVYTAAHWHGLRMGSLLTSAISATIALLFLVLVAGCLLIAPAAPATPASGALAGQHAQAATLLAAIPAVRALLTAYDGWYAPLYMAEENVDAARTLPRAIIGGALLVVALYLAYNLALLRVLPLTVLAASPLPAAAAAGVLLRGAGAVFVTVTAMLTVLSLINSNMLITPRVLYALARDGWIPAGLAAVSERGTPRPAVAMTVVAAATMILSGTFNQIIAVFAVLILSYYVSAFLAIFVLRRRAPRQPRPYRIPGYPVTPLVVLLATLAILAGAVIDDLRSAVIAVGFVAACVPAYLWAARARSRRLATA